MKCFGLSDIQIEISKTELTVLSGVKSKQMKNGLSCVSRGENLRNLHVCLKCVFFFSLQRVPM